MNVGTIRSIIVPPTKPGSLGDQAMVDVLVTQAAGLFRRPPVVLPSSYHTRSESHGIDFDAGVQQRIRGALEVMRARHMLIVGADILDGHYGKVGIGRRLTLAHLAHRCGVKVRVVGCSFSTAPHPQTIKRLQQMPWLEILARDPVSRDRMQAALGRNIRLVADVAFLLEPALHTAHAKAGAEWISRQRQGNRQVFALNVSGHAFSRLPQGALEVFADIVAERLAHEGNVAAIVVPHDWRPGEAGDLDVCRTLYEALEKRPEIESHLLADPIPAWEAKALVGLVDATLSSRMHLSIACLGQGVPSYCLVYAGKFDGLMQHFNLSGALFDPVGLSGPEGMRAPIERMLAHWQRDRQTVKKALPDVLALSKSNFDDLA